MLQPRRELDTLLNTIEYGILFLDANLDLRLGNRAYREIFGVPAKLVESCPNARELFEFCRERGIYPFRGTAWDAYVEMRLKAIRAGDIAPTELNLAEQQERKRLAVELHDHLQHLLVLGKIKIGQGKRYAQQSPAVIELMRQVDDVLSARREGQTALVVFAGEAFTVTPLTDDVETIRSQLTALSTDIMPAPGSRGDKALLLAGDLLRQAGMTHGRILLVTDEAGARGADAARSLNAAGYRVSVLGAGTTSGAPVPLPDGAVVTCGTEPPLTIRVQVTHL